MYSSFPDLNWARLRVFDEGEAEVLDCDGNVHRFETKREAINWLLEDEFTAFENLDADEEVDYGIKISELVPPAGKSDYEILSLMYVKRNHS